MWSGLHRTVIASCVEPEHGACQRGRGVRQRRRLAIYDKQDDQANDFMRDYRANAEVVVRAQRR
jgi:hypothetical protein